MRTAIALILVLVIGLTVWSLMPGENGKEGPVDGPEAPGATPEQTLARDLVAAFVSKEEWNKARRALAPLVEGDDAAFEDLITAAVLELKAGDIEDVQRYLDRARSVDPASAVLDFLDGRIDHLVGDVELATEHYRSALSKAPKDPAAKYLLALGVTEAGPWYISSVYALYQIYTAFTDNPQEERRYDALWTSLRAEGHQALKPADLHEGELARILPPPAIGNFASGPVTVPTFTAAGDLEPAMADGRELLVTDLDGDRQADLLTASPNGIQIKLRDDVTGVWLDAVRVTDQPARLVRAIDLSKDDSLDLVYVSGNTLALLECEGDADAEVWRPTTLTLPALAGAVTDLELVDFDHDGDLDLALVGDFGLQILRNDGAAQPPRKKNEEDEEEEAPPRGNFTDVTSDLGASVPGPIAWIVIEDVDGDQDVDLLLGGADGTSRLANLRGGRLEETTPSALAGLSAPTEPLLADFDGDARVDVLAPGSPARLLLQTATGEFEPADAGGDVPLGVQLLEVDLDLDGRVDVVWGPTNAAGAGILAVGTEHATPFTFGDGGRGALVVTDLADFRDALTALPTYELVRLGASSGPERWDTVGVGLATRIRFRGLKDNRQGIGAVVELRAGATYRRQFYRGEETLYGLGKADFADVLRITWPNGIVQSEVDVEKGLQILDKNTLGEQAEGLIGSCPFLYTWDGTAFTFISDVLGITPLGLPMAPGVLVPPDHDEYVLVTGEQLAANEDGEFVLQFTEELREVTYLDQVRLDVVDHPIGTEIQPNERFCFPPFPVARTHVMGNLLAPTKVTGSDGKDWTAELAAVDDTHPQPFEPLADVQFLGLATPHWLELEFDPAQVAGAEELRLVCTGWFYWTDASVNVAAARTPGVDFVPPIIEVPFDGGWRPIGPPVGFPAGKTKSMVLDLSEVLNPADPRLRIGSTLRLYWDSIRLAVGGDEEQRTTSIACSSADLWARGFSQPLPAERADLPERFVWEERSLRPRWNQHPGRYTKFGEVLELVTTVDDRFVVMGAGDALTLRFDAAALPPLPDGWTRDYLVFFDGWAKDRDPNTVEALTVEPLPFHGMSAYPYPADEAFPDTPAHRAWREQWQTREAFELIVPLSPERRSEWEAATFTPPAPRQR